jgi:hypothetical protein
VTLVREQEGRQKRRLVEVKFYLTPEEFTNMETIAMYIYREKAIPKATVNSFAKSAAYKWYNEINGELKKREQNAKAG